MGVEELGCAEQRPYQSQEPPTYSGIKHTGEDASGAVESGLMAQAIRQRMEKTRACSSRGVCDCQIACE